MEARYQAEHSRVEKWLKAQERQLKKKTLINLKLNKTD